jgi:OmpA family/PEGA domain
MRMKLSVLTLLTLSTFALLWANPALAHSSQDTAKLKIHVEPRQAYIFVDGKAIRHGSHTIRLTAGDHSISVRNYGYTAKTQKVDLTSGNKTRLNVDLQPFGKDVSGPFADIEFKGDPQAAVLLNGNTPAYFVGHVDEFNWDWIWHQRLLVQPGSYHITVRHEGNTIWSGNVDAHAGQKVIVYMNSGREKTKNFKPGETLGSLPRFHAGIASATVPVAPVTAELAADTTSLGCGANDTLKWNSANAVSTTITGLGSVPLDGDRAVTPAHDTTYALKAVGPGGIVTRTVKVDVNHQPTATLALSQPEIHYHKIGDKVVEDDSATLTWSASNASSATISPFGKENVNGNRTISADPKQSSDGPVNEDLTYTLTASNACGGAVTRTATLRVVGSIDPPPSTTLASVFYPTAYPTRRHPKVGLVPSEKAALDRLAAQFKNFGNYENNANLVIIGYADVRGSQNYNQALSERRAELAKAYLVAKGVPAAEVKVEARGKDDQIPMNHVESLEAKDPQKPDKFMVRDERATWLAYNRRVDIVLEPTGKKSSEMYPDSAASARLLWQEPRPSLKAFSTVAGTSNSREQASLTTHGS